MRKAGFTLLEFLILLGLFASLAVFTVFVLNPKEIWQEFQDAKKVSQLNKLKAELLDYFLKNPAASCNEIGSPAGSLPQGFSYHCDPNTKTFEIDVNLESSRYSKGGKTDLESTDGGDQSEIYETGNNLNL